MRERHWHPRRDAGARLLHHLYGTGTEIGVYTSAGTFHAELTFLEVSELQARRLAVLALTPDRRF